MVSGGEDEVEVSVAVLVCRRLHSVDAGVRVRPIDIEPPAGVVDVVAVGIYELGSGEGAVPVPGEPPEARAMRAPGARYECQVDDVVTGQLDGPEVADGVAVAARVPDAGPRRPRQFGGVIGHDLHSSAGVSAFSERQAGPDVEHEKSV